MTNEELIAQAKKICLQEVEWYSDQSDPTPVRDLNSWTTHLAEIDDHEEIFDGSRIICKCGSAYKPNKSCPKLLTKAKRLLRQENLVRPAENQDSSQLGVEG